MGQKLMWLRVLPQRFQETPVQSVRAYLNLTLPPGTDRWDMDTYLAMVRSIYLAKHRVLIKETMPLTVELYDREEGTSLSYGAVIQKGLVAIPQQDECPRIEAAEDLTSDEEGSTTSESPTMQD
ncbi:uncharacterized protein LOC143298243 [Babylonia areolata]|uniref:uncharacterized protein LOC143298243 n=1 Tax=Babylonia areolata TaxID=304850 RepID=UPI003FD27E9B